MKFIVLTISLEGKRLAVRHDDIEGVSCDADQTTCWVSVKKGHMFEVVESFECVVGELNK